MMEPFDMIIAIFYASIFTASYKKTGILPALFWPITIIMSGILVYMTVVFNEPPDK